MEYLFDAINMETTSKDEDDVTFTLEEDEGELSEVNFMTDGGRCYTFKLCI